VGRYLFFDNQLTDYANTLGLFQLVSYIDDVYRMRSWPEDVVSICSRIKSLQDSIFRMCWCSRRDSKSDTRKSRGLSSILQYFLIVDLPCPHGSTLFGVYVLLWRVACILFQTVNESGFVYTYPAYVYDTARTVSRFFLKPKPLLPASNSSRWNSPSAWKVSSFFIQRV